MARWIPPDPETKSAFNIGFEIQMLGDLPRWVMHFDDEGMQTPMVACQEATLLHARALIEFLFGRPRKDGPRYRKPTDESPARFGTAWAPGDSAAFDGWLDLIDKHLVHLSIHRLENATTAPEHYLSH